MANSKDREKRRAARLRKNEKLKAASMELEELIEDAIDEDDDDIEDEVTAKEVDEPAVEVAEKTASVPEVISEVVPESPESNLDALELEALIAKDRRRLSFLERFGDWIEKKKLTYSASGEDFALDNKSHVRNALARAAQMINEGGQAAEDARKALPKIRAAAKKMGIGEMNKDRSSVVVEKDASGKWRAIMWPSNNFRDLDGEIISEKAHKEYVEWVNENMDVAPVFETWHKSGTRREAQVDFIGYENGFLLMSAPLTEKEAAGLLRAQAKTDIGMSHGSLVILRHGQDKRVIEKYRMVEVSDLPLENAANPFTDFETLTKEVEMDTKEYLASVLGSDELAEKYLAKTQDKQDALRKAGVEEKAQAPAPDAPPAAEAKPAEPLTIEDVVARVSKELGMEQLSEQFAKLQEAAQKVEILEAVVKDLSKSQDEKLAEMIQPKIEKSMSWMNLRPSQKEETVLKDGEEDQKLKKAKPETGWLSELTGTTPLQ